MTSESDTAENGPILLEIVSRRTIDAPRERVFDAFRDPEQLARWWGPDGFTNDFQEFDFRPGGAWRFVMHAPDGSQYDNESEFLEIVAPEKIVFHHHKPVHLFVMTMTFVDRDGQTELTWRMGNQTILGEPAEFERLILEANEQNFDRLERMLNSSD